MKGKRFYFRFLIVVCVALILECTCFQWNYWGQIIFSRGSLHNVYRISDLQRLDQTQNWMLVPQNGAAKSVQITWNQQEKPDITIFLGDNQQDAFAKPGETYQEPFLKFDREYSCLIFSFVGLEEAAFDQIEIQLNPPSFSFSVSRVVAMVLIYLFGSFLFWFQKTPEYELE